MKESKSHKESLENIRVYEVKPKLTDVEIAKLEGMYFTEEDFDIIVKENADIYRLDSMGNRHLLLKIRKNVIPSDICKKTFMALQEEAKKPHTNRGAAAGILSQRKLPPYVKEIIAKGKFRGKYIGHDDRVRKDDISNLSRSSIIGYYDQIDRNYYRRLSRKKDKQSVKVPCRVTKFVKDQPKKWEETFDFYKVIDNQFKKLVPDAHMKQQIQASKTPEYQILDTAFSTSTINYNWQTALHRDAGDFEGGFGNLVILEDPLMERQTWSGGYLGFPQYKIAVDVRNGDFLAMDVHQWHSNTPIIKGDIKELEHARLSIVSYLRKNMIKCTGSNSKSKIKSKKGGADRFTGGPDPFYSSSVKQSHSLQLPINPQQNTIEYKLNQKSKKLSRSKPKTQRKKFYESMSKVHQRVLKSGKFNENNENNEK
jgi:hypothetical protein